MIGHVCFPSIGKEISSLNLLKSVKKILWIACWGKFLYLFSKPKKTKMVCSIGRMRSSVFWALSSFQFQISPLCSHWLYVCFSHFIIYEFLVIQVNPVEIETTHHYRRLIRKEQIQAYSILRWVFQLYSFL